MKQENKARFIHSEYIDNLLDLVNGFEVDDDTLYNMCENVTNPLNEQYPERYNCISEEQYLAMKKEAIARGIYDEFEDEATPVKETEPAHTPTSKEGLTYKVECLDNSTAHYTHDKKEAYEVYAKFIIDFGDTIRLYEAPMPINDHDEIDWETIECYDVDENESKEGLEDGGFTKGEIFLDEGDFDRNGTPDELYIRGRLNDETFDICNFGCNDTGFALDYATALVARYNQASTLYKENKEQIDLLKWVVNEIETTPDELSDALLGMIKIKCNQLFTRINKD